MIYDAFISYSSKDKVRAERLAQSLRNDGLRIWFDDWEIRPGDDILLRIERGLQNSTSLILLLSSNALKSEWIALERTTTLFRNPRNTQRRFIPVLIENCMVPDVIARYRIIDFRDESLDAYQQIFRACVDKVREDLEHPQIQQYIAMDRRISLSGLVSKLAFLLRKQNFHCEVVASPSKTSFHVIVECAHLFRVRELILHILSFGHPVDSLPANTNIEAELGITQIGPSELVVVLTQQGTMPDVAKRKGWTPVIVDEFLTGLETGSYFLHELLLNSFPLSKFNPYQSFHAVTSKMFFGRKEEIAKLLEPGLNYAVIGPRRIGKSSLALHLRRILRTFGWEQQREGLKKSRFAVSYVDCDSLTGPEDLWAMVLYDMTLEQRDLSQRVLRKIRLGTKDISYRSDFEVLGHLLHQKYRRFVLVIDEVDSLIEDDAKRGWRVFRKLRALFDETQGRRKLVLFGYKTLNEVMKINDFPLYGRIAIRQLPALSGRYVDALIYEPMSELGITFEDLFHLQHMIHLLTGGLPNVVQEVCKTIVDNVEDRSNPLSKARLKEILDRRRDDLSYRIGTFIHQMPDTLPKLIGYLFVRKEVLRLDEVVTDLAHKHNIRLDRQTVYEALEMLCLDNILRSAGKQDTYVFTSKLIKYVMKIQAHQLVGAGLMELFIEEVKKELRLPNDY